MMGQVPANWPANYPEWWYDADPAKSMIDVSNLDDPANQSPILQGQLLHMAYIGIQELDEQLGPVGGAGFTVDDFKDSSREPSYNSPAAIGQLKYVVSKFYDRFAQVGYEPGSAGWNPSIILDERQGDNSTRYPWKDDQTPENMSIALIGQAKFLFAWDLSLFIKDLPPKAPSNLIISYIDDSSLMLTWQDNSNNEDGFIIYGQTSSGNWE